MKSKQRKFNIGDKVVIKTNRLDRFLKNDIVIVSGLMAKGGYIVEDLLGKSMGQVITSDIKNF